LISDQHNDPDTQVMIRQPIQSRRFPNGKKVVSYVIKSLFTGGCVIWLLSAIQWELTLETLRNVDWFTLSIAFIVFNTRHLPSAARWVEVAHLSGFPISFKESVLWYFVGGFFNMFLPTGRGGDVVRGVITSRRHNYSLSGVMTTIFFERLVGMIVTFCFALAASLIAAPHFGEIQGSLLSLFALGVAIAFIVFILLNSAFQSVVKGFFKVFHIKFFEGFADKVFSIIDMCFSNRRVLIWTVFLSALGQVIFIFSAYLAGLALPDFAPPWYSYAVIIPLIFLSELLPSVGGYGIREVGYVVLFGWFGVQQDASAAFALLQLLFLLGSALFGAVGFISVKSFSAKKQIVGA
jgi:uncharacterized protein (TIRG00374 family)